MLLRAALEFLRAATSECFSVRFCVLLPVLRLASAASFVQLVFKKHKMMDMV